mmetsp:Transcript_20698/g.63968  ORF Transcript_20698/g.63968 Transcript_20698/m.63968 type:complete len:87 (-) Transcript_20698:454-714(-)
MSSDISTPRTVLSATVACLDEWWPDDTGDAMLRRRLHTMSLITHGHLCFLLSPRLPLRAAVGLFVSRTLLSSLLLFVCETRSSRAS